MYKKRTVQSFCLLTIISDCRVRSEKIYEKNSCKIY